jgi:phosphohistidine phosphatase
MPKRLLLVRHAKSDWNDVCLPDHERPLNDRGRREAPRVGKMLRHSDREPNLIISSTARRARNTAKKIARACHYDGYVLKYPELYNAPPERILSVIQQVIGDPQTLMVVGHNPGMEALTSQLARQPVTMSTATLADLTIDINAWSELTVDSGATLVEVWTANES